jgi:hypothetical protein
MSQNKRKRITVKKQQRIRHRARPHMAARDVHQYVEQIIGDDIHAKQVLSLAYGVLGIIHVASLAIAAIGTGLAMVRGLLPKHAIKQVDRLLSNKKIDPDILMSKWVSFVIGERKEVVIAMDWTEFDPDNHSTIALYLLTGHGRATPLLWKTVSKSALKDQRNGHEDSLLARLHAMMPEGVRVTIIADRGFGDHKLYEFLEEHFGWDYIIRFREIITITSAKGESHPAREWLTPTGRARMMRSVKVTHEGAPVPAVVLVHAKNMKDPWCLATSRTDLTASKVVKLYGKRFTIEETFRDQKDNHYGMGLYVTHIKNPARRDRLLFPAAMSHALLTMLGAACEETGLDRMLRANTVKRRTHSLYRQGTIVYGMIPTMPDEWLEPLMEAFGEIIQEHQITNEIFGVI